MNNLPQNGNQTPTIALPWAWIVEDLMTRWKFKFWLPRLKRIELEGIQLDVSGLSSVMKNNLRLGRYEVQERTLAARFLTADDAVLEVGGGIGFIGLFCQLRLGIRRYATVEANPQTMEMLKRNYALNHRVPLVWNLALASDDREVTLNLGAEFWENSVVEANGATHSVRVPGISLGNLIRRLDYSPTALIMDIEGAEKDVDFSQLPATVRKIIIELHPHLIGHAASSQIVDRLSQLGFAVGCSESGTTLFLRS